MRTDFTHHPEWKKSSQIQHLISFLLSPFVPLSRLVTSCCMRSGRHNEWDETENSKAAKLGLGVDFGNITDAVMSE